MYRVWILIIAFGITGCQKPAPLTPPPAAPETTAVDPIRGHLLHAQPRLPTVKVWVGAEELVTEIAWQPVEVATGMMFRTNLAEHEAMIFVFPDAAPRSFYMRNCLINLAGAYLSPAGEILQILDMKKGDETSLPSTASNVQFVLEAPEGWFARHGVSTGAVIRTERGSLRETFFGSN